jgi:hypothetical protein
MMRKLISIILFAATTSGSFAGEAQLAGADLHAAVAGKTVYVQSPMGEIPIRYAANGTLHGRTELALLDGESQTSDRGRWWVSDKKLCIQWHSWMEGKAHCFTMHRIGGSTVRWRRDDGKSGTARLG